MSKDYLSKTVVFDSPYGSINAPISAFLDQEDIDEIIKNNDKIEEDIEAEIVDIVYFNLDIISKIV